MGVFYQPNGLLWGPVFQKNHHQPEPHNVLGLRRTCPPVVTAAATSFGGVSFSWQILISPTLAPNWR